MTSLCTKCGADSKVTDSRLQPVGVVRRRRACLSCDFRWTTVEVTKEPDTRMEILKHTRELEGVLMGAIKVYLERIRRT